MLVIESNSVNSGTEVLIENYAMSNVTLVLTKSATISFFLFSSFPSPGSSFSLFLFFRYFDFGASRA